MEPQFAFSVPDAAKLAGLGKSLLYEEIREGRLKTFRVGSRRLVSRDALEQYIREREQETGTGSRRA